jgi:hypothetical protein
MRWTDLTLRSRAREPSSIVQGRFVAFTCPSITGPATSKEAASTDSFTRARNSATIACKLG